MKGDTKNEIDTSIIKCESGNSRFLMVNRWELGNCSYTEKLRYLHIDYEGTERKFNEVSNKASLTQEMKYILCTLPESISKLSNLKVLNVFSFNNDYVGNRENICLRKLPDSIGNLVNLRILDLSSNNLKELYLSKNHNLSNLPNSIGNLESLKILDLQNTNLYTLPKTMENLINLENLSLSKSVNEAGPHTYGCNRNSERIYVTKDYSSYWYRSIVERWCKGLRNSYYPRDENLWKSTSNINLSKKKLKQIPFGIHFITELNKLDVSGNQFTKIPHLLKKLCLRTLYIHNNPNLNHLPDFLWSMPCLIELKIDGKLIKDLPKNAQFSLDKKSLEDKIVDLTLTGKYERGMSDQDLSNMTGPYTVHLKKN